jgi:hypothetical protein
MHDVVISNEERRGCGYRKPSAGGVGIYLMGPSTGSPCGRMPFALKACPTCGGGIKPSRGWNWITPRDLFGPAPDQLPTSVLSQCKLNEPFIHDVLTVNVTCQSCPLGGAIPEGRHGLIWIGEAHYPTPEDFLLEAKRLGLSRKIGALPKGFELGKTIVYLAHRKAIKVPTLIREPLVSDDELKSEFEYRPGIFATFKPTGVDLVIADENAVPEKATKLAEKIGDGARIVRVIPKEGEQQSLPIVDKPTTPWPFEVDEYL